MIKESFFERYSFALFLGIGFLILLILRVFGFDGLYGQDAYEYARHTENLRHFIFNGASLNDFFWPSGYPILCLPIHLLFRDLTWSMQITSCVCWSQTLYFTYRLLKEQSSPSASPIVLFLFTLAGLGFSPYFLRLGFSGMSDMASALFVVLVFFQLTRFINSNQKTHFYLLCLFVACSLFVRFASFFLILIPVIYAYYHLLKHKEYKPLVIGTSMVIVLSSLIFWIKDISDFSTLITHIFSNWNPQNLFQNSHENGLAHYEYPFINLIYVCYSFLHPAFFVGGIVLVPLLFFTKKKPPLYLILSLLLYLLFIGGINLQNKRFLVISIPMVLLICSFSLSAISSYWNQKRTITVLLGFLICTISLSIYGLGPVYHRQQIEKNISAKIVDYDPSVIYTFDMDLALRGRGFKGQLINLWFAETVSPNGGDFILLNVEAWHDQWKQHGLMVNVAMLLNSGRLHFKEDLGENWILYVYE